MKSPKLCLIAMMLMLPLVTGAAAKSAHQKEIEQRMEKRYPDILALKKAGTVGETFEGYLAVREGKDEKISKLVDDENADRKEVFEIIAKSSGATVEKVAERAGKRAFDKAKPGEYLKGEDGKWTKKT